MNLPKIGKPRLVSSNPEGAEALRKALVPRYEDCQFAAFGDGEPPSYVGCTNAHFGAENYGECLGQCALSGKQYGGFRLKPITGLY